MRRFGFGIVVAYLVSVRETRVTLGEKVMKASRNHDRRKPVRVEPTTLVEGNNEFGIFKNAGLSKGACDDCAEILHGLNNVLASMLLNAQVMEWKLPSYSRSRRYLHEIERNAQRGGELVKRLLERLDAEGRITAHDGRTGRSFLGADAATRGGILPPAAGVDSAPDSVQAP